MDLLFIQGPEKTATSTITGILNCHPDIFILFENYVAQSAITKYGNQFLEKYPNVRHHYREENDYGKPLRDIFEDLSKSEPNFDYKIAGTKINSLDPFVTQKANHHQAIFMMRDIKSWLIKESVIKLYRTDLDVVTPSIEYLKYIVQSHGMPNIHKLWMEQLITENDRAISDLSAYLGFLLKPHTDHWWEKIANLDASDPKSVFKLKHVHHSSRIKPESLDTEYELLKHPFWDSVNTIFDKYYLSDPKTQFSESQIKDDLIQVNELRKHAPLPFSKAYSYVHSVRLGFKDNREVFHMSEFKKEGEKRSLFSKIFLKANRIWKAIFRELNRNKKWAFFVSFYDEMRAAFELLLIMNF